MKVNSKKTHFARIDNDITPMDITDTDLLANYSAEVIEFAKKLKGQHEKGNTSGTQRFTDKYYLDYAQRYIVNLHTAQNNARLVYALHNMNNSVPDPEWSEYSYEEIIAMADNGVNVPPNVLGWAKAQQESDVISYIIVSDNAENDDNSSTSEVSGEDDINKLQAQATSYITRANKQQKKVVEKAIIIEQSVQEVKHKKTKFEKRAIDTVQDTKNIEAELKTLEEKKNLGTLTPTEMARYKELVQMLGSEASRTLELQREGIILNDFLDSIDDFNENKSLALKLSKEAKDAGINFGQLNKIYNTKNITHATNNFQMLSLGTLEDLMSGISNDFISDITIMKSKDFEQIGEDADKLVQNSNPAKTISFAKKETKTNESEQEETSATDQATGILIKSNPSNMYSMTKANDAYADYNKSENDKIATQKAEKESSDLDNVETEAGYGPDIAGGIKTSGMVNTAAGGIAAMAAGTFMNFNAMATMLIPTNITNTALTLTSMATLAINNSNVKKTKGILNGNEKTLDNEMKNLEKEQDRITKEHEANLALGEILYAQAKELDEKTQEYILNLVTKAEEKQAKSQNNSEVEQDNKNQETLQIEDPNAGQRLALAGQMDKLAQEDAKVFTKTKTPLKRAEKAEINAAKSLSSFNNQNKQLDGGNKVNKTQSILSVATGGLSLIIGVVGLFKGQKLIATGTKDITTGTSMLGNPYTSAIGALLIAKGARDVSKGVYGVGVSTLALISGGAAGLAGAGGLILTNQVKGNVKDNSKTALSESKHNQQQRKLYLQIKKAMAKSKQAKVPQIAAQSPEIAQIQGATLSSSQDSSPKNSSGNNNFGNIASNNMQKKTFATSNTINAANTAENLVSPAAKKSDSTIPVQSRKQTDSADITSQTIPTTPQITSANNNINNEDNENSNNKISGIVSNNKNKTIMSKDTDNPKNIEPNDNTDINPEETKVDEENVPENLENKDEVAKEPEESTDNNIDNGDQNDNIPALVTPNRNNRIQKNVAPKTEIPTDKTTENLPQDKRLENATPLSYEEKMLLKEKNVKAAKHLNQAENKDEDKISVVPSQVKDVDIKPKEEPKKPEFYQVPQNAPKIEVVPIKDNNGRTVNLSTDRIQTHTNRKFEEIKLKDEENLKKTKEEQKQKELANNINNTNTEVLKNTILGQIEIIANNDGEFEDKNPTETNTIISNQIDMINSLKQRFASIDDRSENISASATVNANPKDRIHTDDKADKKLARFNNDSIIESKKKRKKVVAVSEAFGGKTTK